MNQEPNKQDVISSSETDPKKWLEKEQKKGIIAIGAIIVGGIIVKLSGIFK